MVKKSAGSTEPPMQLLAVREVARLLYVHPNTVRNWSDRGLLKTYRIGSRQDRRFDWADVVSFLQNSQQALKSEQPANGRH